jgi:fucose permease
MKDFLLRMFSDKSDINQKAVLGFVSFVLMVLYAIVDIVTGAIGITFVIEPIVFNGLMYTALTMCGITGVEAVFGNKNIKGHESK